MDEVHTHRMDGFALLTSESLDLHLTSHPGRVKGNSGGRGHQGLRGVSGHGVSDDRAGLRHDARVVCRTCRTPYHVQLVRSGTTSSSISLLRNSSRVGRFRPQIRSIWYQNGQIWDFLGSCFSTFWLVPKNCLKKHQICPIRYQSDVNSSQLGQPWTTTGISLSTHLRDGRFGSKVGQIGSKWDKSGVFFRSGHLGPIWSTLEPNLPSLY